MLKIKSFNDNKLCDVLLGLFNPFKHELPDYHKYDITKLKDNCRFLEVILNRGGNSGGLTALFFDGAVCDWAELPRPEDKEQLLRVYSYIDKIRKKKLPSKVFFIFNYLKLVLKIR